MANKIRKLKTIISYFIKHYGWVVYICSIEIFTCSGRFYTAGVYYKIFRVDVKALITKHLSTISTKD